MTDFRLVLPGVTPDEVAAMAAGPSLSAGVHVRVSGDEIRA